MYSHSSALNEFLPLDSNENKRTRLINFGNELINFGNEARPHYAEGNWKPGFHFENSSNVLRPPTPGGISKRKLGQEKIIWKNLSSAVTFPTPHGRRVLKTILHGAHCSLARARVLTFEDKRIREKDQIRQRRKERSSNPQPGPAPSIPCPYCNRHFRAKIALFSHLRTHSIPQWFEVMVFFASEGRTSLFSKSFVLKMSSVQTKSQSRRFYANSSGLKSVFQKLHFRDGLVWALGLTGEIKLRFQISPVWCGLGPNHCRCLGNRQALNTSEAHPGPVALKLPG